MMHSFSPGRSNTAFSLSDTLFCSTNAGKITEARLFFGDALKVLDASQPQIDLPEEQSLDPVAVTRTKLLFARQNYSSPWIMVEDTMMAAEAFSPPGSLQLPGTFIKFFAGSSTLAPRQSFDWMYERAAALNLLGAKALTCVGIIGPDESQMVIAAREMPGQIAEPRGENGFGWDRIFVPEGHSKTLAEMSFSEKQSVSMRTQAFYAILRELEIRGIVSPSSPDLAHIDWDRVRQA